MNLQYTSVSSECTLDDICSIVSPSKYAVFSSSNSKQYNLEQFKGRDSLMIDDICPLDCSYLNNNFAAPYFILIRIELY